MNYIPAILAFIIVAALIPFLCSLARRKGMLDVPNERSSHSIPIPRTGGICIAIGVFIGFASGFLLDILVPDTPLLFVLAGLALGAIIGFIDDLISLPSMLRMLVYLSISAGIATFGCQVEIVHLPGIPEIEIGFIGGVVFTTLFIAWYLNLFNFMDGIDGIAGCAAVVTIGSLATVFFSNALATWGVLASVGVGATVAFLLFNYPPALVFMGDGGSVFLGTMAGSLSIFAVERHALSLPAALFLMLPFVFDATFTLIRRISNRETFWSAHRSHVYQQMCDLGLSHRNVTVIYTVAAVVFATIGLFFDHWSPDVQVIVWWGSLGVLLLVSVYVVRKNRKKSIANE